MKYAEDLKSEYMDSGSASSSVPKSDPSSSASKRGPSHWSELLPLCCYSMLIILIFHVYWSIHVATFLNLLHSHLILKGLQTCTPSYYFLWWLTWFILRNYDLVYLREYTFTIDALVDLRQQPCLQLSVFQLLLHPELSSLN